LVGILGKYSKFASAGEKATLRQSTTTLTQAAASDDRAGSAPF
jgi:hypothetical protein